MDGNVITAKRTAAVSAIATKVSKASGYTVLARVGLQREECSILSALFMTERMCAAQSQLPSMHSFPFSCLKRQSGN